MRWWFAWIHLLKRREDALSLGLVRIGVGLVILEDLFTTWSSGAFPVVWGDVRDIPEGFRNLSHAQLVFWDGRSPAPEWVAAATALLAGLLGLGVFSRVTALLCLQGCIALYGLNPMAGGGHDRVITNALWLLVLSDSGRSLSLTARWRTGQWTDPTPIPAWPRYLMIGQLILMYTATGLQKLAPEWFFWGRLLAVYNMLLTPAWARFDLAPVLGWLAPLTQVGTLITWLWESSFWMVGLWLLLRAYSPSSRLRRYDLRSVYAVLGLLFHFGLLVMGDLGPFSLICMVLYPALYHPDELRKGWQRIRSFRRMAGAPSGQNDQDGGETVDPRVNSIGI